MIVTDLSFCSDARHGLDSHYIPYAETRHEQDDCLFFSLITFFLLNCFLFLFFSLLSGCDLVGYVTFYLPLFLPGLVVHVVSRYGRRFSLSDSGAEC